MAGKQVPLVQIPDERINRMQGNIVPPLNQLLGIPFNDGILLKDQILQAGSNVVNHRLGRQVQGYLVLKQNAAAGIYYTNLGDKTMTLVSAANVTIDLWVF